MRYTLSLTIAAAMALTALSAFAATGDDEVRLDHKNSMAMDMPMTDEGDAATDDSGSTDLSMKIERGGYATADDADNDIGGNGPLSRDGGFNFGAAN